MMWTEELVQQRILEAYETMMRLPPVPKPRQPGNSAIPYARMLEMDPDMIYIRSADDIRDDNSYQKRPPTAAMIRRGDEVTVWLLDFLKDRQGWAVCIKGWAKCALYKKSFSKWCKKNRISRATAYRKIEQASKYVTEILNERGVAVEPADLDNAIQVRQILDRKQ